LLSDFAFDLAPGATVVVTQTANIVTNTTNVATWSTVDADMGTAGDTDEATVYVFDTVQSFDSCIDFESGSLPSSMVPVVDEFGVANGRVTVDGSNPFNGNFAMNLDTDSSGIAFTNQAAVLAVDLNGQTDAELYFWVSNQGDENHAQDGVFFSDDNGATYTKVLSFNNFPAQYVNVHLDIDQLAADNGLTLTDNFLIKFQAFDNFPLGQDGYSIDDICVQPATPTLYYSSKSAPEQVTTGDTFTYTVNIVNTGLLTATGIIVSDTVPVGTTYVANSVSASSGTAGEIAGIVGWTGDVGANQAVALTFEVTVTAAAGETITNTAAIMHSSLPADLERQAVTEVVAAEPDITYDANQARASLASDQTVSQTLTIGNVGFAELNWTAYETDCTTPAEIGWVDVSPTSGTIGRDESSDLLLTFDSTGLSSGVYTDILCVATDDPNAAEVNIPVHLVVNNTFSINFTATVGTDPNSCAASSSVNNVSPGSEVTYCYQIENTSTVAFDTHELSELTAGVLLTDTVTTIIPGETVTITATQTVTDSVTLDLTWMASNGGFIATDSDTVTVNVGTTLYLPVINRP
ncbi:MAG: DUF11 domain-containing protein, partial [Anaerolineales bacterium]|nr:DUF11 domain-containing protein [Anaerolineales bacterium]